MIIPLPKSADTNNPKIIALCKSISKDSDPLYLDVEMIDGTIPNECYENVEKMISNNGGEIQYGWQIWETLPGVMAEAEFHAVWKNPDGQLKDISFKKNKVSKILFVEDLALVYTGNQVNNVRLNLFPDMVVDHFIETCDILFKLSNKGDRARLYGQAFVNSLTPEQLAKQQEVTIYKQVLMKFLNDGGNEDSPCFCDSGQKYKNCHARVMPKLRTVD